MLKTLAILFGLIFLAIGILGFLPEYMENGKLLGIFNANAIHNIFHISTGVIALLCGLSSTTASRFYFIIFGLIFAGLAAYGYVEAQTELLFGFIPTNMADNYLRTGISVVYLLFGLTLRRQ